MRPAALWVLLLAGSVAPSLAQDPKTGAEAGRLRLVARPRSVAVELALDRVRALDPLVARLADWARQLSSAALCSLRREALAGQRLLPDGPLGCPDGGDLVETGGHSTCRLHDRIDRRTPPPRNAPRSGEQPRATSEAGWHLLREISYLEVEAPPPAGPPVLQPFVLGARLERVDVRSLAESVLGGPTTDSLFELAGPAAARSGDRVVAVGRTPPAPEEDLGPSSRPVLELDAALPRGVRELISRRLSRIPGSWEVPVGLAAQMWPDRFHLTLLYAHSAGAAEANRGMGLALSAARWLGTDSLKGAQKLLVDLLGEVERSTRGPRLELDGPIPRDLVAHAIEWAGRRLPRSLPLPNRPKADRPCAGGLAAIDRAAALWAQETGAPPGSVDLLLRGGFIPAEPTCPGGGSLRVGGGGTARCSLHDAGP